MILRSCLYLWKYHEVTKAQNRVHVLMFCHFLVLSTIDGLEHPVCTIAIPSISQLEFKSHEPFCNVTSHRLNVGELGKVDLSLLFLALHSSRKP